MTTFTLTIELGNEAKTWHDIITALDDLVIQLGGEAPEYMEPHAQERTPIYNYNGNTVGQWSVTE